MLQTATIMQDKDTIYEIMMHRILLKIKTVTISINLVVNSYIVAVTTIRNVITVACEYDQYNYAP